MAFTTALKPVSAQVWTNTPRAVDSANPPARRCRGASFRGRNPLSGCRACSCRAARRLDPSRTAKCRYPHSNHIKHRMHQTEGDHRDYHQLISSPAPRISCCDESKYRYTTSRDLTSAGDLWSSIGNCTPMQPCQRYPRAGYRRPALA